MGAKRVAVGVGILEEVLSSNSLMGVKDLHRTGKGDTKARRQELPRGDWPAVQTPGVIAFACSLSCIRGRQRGLFTMSLPEAFLCRLRVPL